MSVVPETLVEERRRVRFTPEDYYAITDAGLLTERTELVDGEIIEMPAQHYPAGAAIVRILFAFGDAMEDRRLLVTDMTVAFASGWNPRPDVAIFAEVPPAHPRGRKFPIPRLVVEVADTTLDYDLGDKAARYAAEGVPELWVADVEGRRMHVHRDPAGDEFRTLIRREGGETVTPLCMPKLTLAVDELIPAYPGQDKQPVL